MNMTKNPTEADLAALLRQCDDTAGNHRCVVMRDGEVTYRRTGADLDLNAPGIQFYGETLIAGNGYVGLAAGNDNAYLKRELAWLKRNWDNGAEGSMPY